MIWGKRIENEVKKCEELARLIEELSRKLNLSAGFKRSGEEAKAEFYRQIDLPFRSWLEALDPQEEQERPIDYEERKCEEWHKNGVNQLPKEWQMVLWIIWDQQHLLDEG